MAGNAEKNSSPVILKRKKLRYHIAKRANLEVETILRTFWDKYGDELAVEELNELERLLEIEDLDFLDIFWGRRKLPRRYSESLFTKIIECWKEKVKHGK